MKLAQFIVGTTVAVGLAVSACSSDPVPAIPPAGDRPPVIVVTDLYHPYQDRGDNLDILTAFGLPDIDLRAVVLDVTHEYEKPIAFPDEPNYSDPNGPRAPGFVPMEQLDWIFDRAVPFARATSTPMRSVDDEMLDSPVEEQKGIELLLTTLRESPRKVVLLSTGSARPIAVAYNRDRALFAAKVERIHLLAGATNPDFLEWNVHLDPKAIVDLLRSPLPIAIYPCAAQGPFDLGTTNTFWTLPDLKWFADYPPSMRAYVHFVLSRSPRTDILAAMGEPPDPSVFESEIAGPHNVWETAAWLQLSHRKLVKHVANGDFEIVRENAIASSDQMEDAGLVPTKVTVSDDGRYRLEPDPTGTSNFLAYRRADPEAQQAALRMAVPRWYLSFAAQARR